MGRQVVGCFVFGMMLGATLLYCNGSYERFVRDMIADPFGGVRLAQADVRHFATFVGLSDHGTYSDAQVPFFKGASLLYRVGLVLERVNKLHL